MGNLYEKIKESNHNFKLSLGQNFLINNNICEKIVFSIDNSSKEVLEIGPGLGSLTDKLVQLPINILAIEKDLELKDILKKRYINNTNIRFIFDDFINYKSEQAFDTIISNLPYEYIKQIFFKLINMNFKEGIFMISENYKKELFAEVYSKNYTIISCLINFFFKVTILIDNIEKDNFMPESSVSSSVVKLVPKYDFDEFKDIRCIFNDLNTSICEVSSNNYNLPLDFLQKKVKDIEIKDLLYIESLKKILFSNLY